MALVLRLEAEGVGGVVRNRPCGQRPGGPGERFLWKKTERREGALGTAAAPVLPGVVLPRPIGVGTGVG